MRDFILRWGFWLFEDEVKDTIDICTLIKCFISCLVTLVTLAYGAIYGTQGYYTLIVLEYEEIPKVFGVGSVVLGILAFMLAVKWFTNSKHKCFRIKI